MYLRSKRKKSKFGQKVPYLKVAEVDWGALLLGLFALDCQR